MRTLSRSLLALLLVAFAGCGGSDGDDPAGSGEPSVPSENRVQIGMTEYAYGMPDDVTGGNVTFEFTNNGELPHEAAFGSIGDHTLEDVMDVIKSGDDPSWAEDLAGVPVLDAGATTSMTRDLEPGNYVFFCFFPVPESGQPHASKGMVHVFTVAGDSGAEGPDPEYTISATDDGFDVPEIAAGTHAIALTNDGSKKHEFAIFSPEPGKTEKDINGWFQSGFKTDKPAVFPGGLQSINPGTSVVVEMTFEAGRTYLVEDFDNQLEMEFEVN